MIHWLPVLAAVAATYIAAVIVPNMLRERAYLANLVRRARFRVALFVLGRRLPEGAKVVLASVIAPATVGGVPTVINVTDPAYGAKGDGVTDDGPAIRAAVAALSAVGGIVYLPPALNGYLIATADTNGNALTLTTASTFIRGGAGLNGSRVKLSGTFTWGVKCAAANCMIEDIYIDVLSGGSVYWGAGVGTLSSSASAEHCRFKNVWVQWETGAVIPTIPGGTSVMNPAGFAVGPEFPGSSSVDIFLTRFEHCEVQGNNFAVDGYSLGNGTAANILGTAIDQCYASHVQNGITLGGCGVTWRSGGFGSTSAATALTGADINVKQGGFPTDPCVFTGARSENGAGRVLLGLSGSSPVSVILDDYRANSCTTSDGKLIDWRMGGTVFLRGGVYSTTGRNTNFAVSGTGSQPARFEADGVTTDTSGVSGTGTSNPYPAAAANLSREIRNASYHYNGTSSINPLPIVGYQRLIDLNTPTLFTASGTYRIPLGAQTLRITLVSAGASGGGGGSSTGATLQSGGGGGAAGGAVRRLYTVGSDTQLTVGVGLGVAGGAGGAAGGNNNGTPGTQGGTSSVTGNISGTVVTSPQSGPGAGSTGGATTAAGGGLYGNIAQLTNTAMSGGGGPSNGNGAGAFGDTGAGGGGGGPATATLGGTGGSAGGSASGGSSGGAHGTSGGSATSAGTNGADAAANSGSGGGGGGGGNNGSAGGNGGAGGSGYVLIEPLN